MLKGLQYGIVLTLGLALMGAYAGVKSGLISANSDAPPGKLETWIASTSLRATLHREAPPQANPVALTDANLLDGVHLFAANCAVCHGSARGLVAASPIARGLYQQLRS